MSEQHDADKIIAYMEDQRVRKARRDGLYTLLAILVCASGFAAFWAGGVAVGLEVTIAAFILASIIVGVYSARHP